MKERLEKRLEELRAEFESGQNMLAELDKKRADLQTTLTRISGAIQVLEEELVRSDAESSGDETREAISSAPADGQELN